MVRLEGFEPPTIRVEAGYSIQLSYSRMYLFILNPLYYPLYECQLVRLTGIEPVRPYGHQILSLRRLPNSATVAIFIYQILFNQECVLAFILLENNSFPFLLGCTTCHSPALSNNVQLKNVADTRSSTDIDGRVIFIL